MNNLERADSIIPPALERAFVEQRSIVPGDEEALERLFRYLQRIRPMTSEIRAAVCELYGIELTELVSRGRSYELSLARQIYCYLAHKHTRLSMTQVARTVGLTDHTTVRHAIRKIGKLAITNPLLADDLDLLRLRICEKALMRSKGAA